MHPWVSGYTKSRISDYRLRSVGDICCCCWCVASIGCAIGGVWSLLLWLMIGGGNENFFSGLISVCGDNMWFCWSSCCCCSEIRAAEWCWWGGAICKKPLPFFVPKWLQVSHFLILELVIRARAWSGFFRISGPDTEVFFLENSAVLDSWFFKICWTRNQGRI